MADGGRQSRGMRDGASGHYDAAVLLLLAPDGLGTSACVVGTCTAQPNCVFFRDDSSEYVLRNGTVTLTWAAASPLAMHLVLKVHADLPASMSGASPLVMKFEELRPDAAGGVYFSVDHELPNVPVQQEANLHVTFDFEGELPSANRGTCSDGLS